MRSSAGSDHVVKNVVAGAEAVRKVLRRLMKS